MNETLTIGQLAPRFGLNMSAILYYEANGVLPEPARVSGQRRYGPDAVRRLEVLDVERAQAMRAWLLTASDCSCTSLDVCALFDRDRAPANRSGGAERLHVTAGGGVAAGS